MTPLHGLCWVLALTVGSLPLAAASERNSSANSARGYPPRMEGARAEVYKQVNETALQLFVFEPAADLPRPRPAIVFFFGGGWRSGSPKQFEPQ